MWRQINEVYYAPDRVVNEDPLQPVMSQPHPPRPGSTRPGLLGRSEFVIFACTKNQRNEEVGYEKDESLVPYHAYAVARVGYRCVSEDNTPGWEIEDVRQLFDAEGKAGVLLPKHGRPISGAFLRPRTGDHDDVLAACNRAAPL